MITRNSKPACTCAFQRERGNQWEKNKHGTNGGRKSRAISTQSRIVVRYLFFFFFEASLLLSLFVVLLLQPGCKPPLSSHPPSFLLPASFFNRLTRNQQELKSSSFNNVAAGPERQQCQDLHRLRLKGLALHTRLARQAQQESPEERPRYYLLHDHSFGKHLLMDYLENETNIQTPLFKYLPCRVETSY